MGPSGTMGSWLVPLLYLPTDCLLFVTGLQSCTCMSRLWHPRDPIRAPESGTATLTPISPPKGIGS
eukprot:gene20506-biopygen8569